MYLTPQSHKNDSITPHIALAAPLWSSILSPRLSGNHRSVFCPERFLRWQINLQWILLHLKSDSAPGPLPPPDALLPQDVGMDGSLPVSSHSQILSSQVSASVGHLLGVSPAMLAKVSSAQPVVCHLGALLWDAHHVQWCVFFSLYISCVCCELVAP